MDPKLIMLAALGFIVAGYVDFWVRTASRSIELLLGYVTNFFDTLGIGSFAPTTAYLKLRRVVPDEKIPGTLNVGHTLPTVVQAFIFIVLIQVEFITLASLIAAAVLGAYGGAGVVARWPRRYIQIGMGFALLAAAILFSMTNLGLFPGGGTAVELRGVKLAAGLLGNFVLGALMTLGIGLYAPCMILVSLLGMNPTAAYPIMMGSCAFLMPIGSIRFIKAGKYDPRVALGLAVGGVPAVLIAALIVKSLPLTWVRWLVVVVVLYAALTMLTSAFGKTTEPIPASAGD